MFIASLMQHSFFALTATLGGSAFDAQSVTARTSWWERTGASKFAAQSHAVRSDLPQSSSRATAADIDRAWLMIDTALGSLRPRTRGLQEALLFQSQEDLSETMRTQFAIDPPSEAFAFRSPLGQGIAVCTEDTPAPIAARGLRAALCGEYLRLACAGDLAPAVQCGLLDFVARWDSTGGGGGVGDAGASLVRSAAGAKNALSVQAILSMDRSQWTAAVAADPHGSLCEQSASIIRFLTQPKSQRGIAAFQAYLRLVAEGTPSSDAFALAYGLSSDGAWRDFDAQWRAFTKSEKANPAETVRERLAFFGEGLRMLDAAGSLPLDFDALAVALTDQRFSAPRAWRPGFSCVSAECASVFSPVDGCDSSRDGPPSAPAKADPSKAAARGAKFRLESTESSSDPKSPPAVVVADSQTLRFKLSWFKTRPASEAPWVWDITRGN